MKKPILIKGEKLIEPIIKKSPFGSKDLPKTYEQAKKDIISSLNIVKDKIKTNTEGFLPNEVIICAKMEEGFLAKSYRPDFLSKHENMTLIGARKLKNENEKENKIYFFRTSVKKINLFLDILNTDSLTATDQKDLCKIKSIDLLEVNEKISGVGDIGSIVNVEIVLHPLIIDHKLAINKIKTLLGENCRIRTYENGPTFILAKINKDLIPNIAQYNFLRTIHPLRDIELPVFDRAISMDLPQACLDDIDSESLTKVGVFDGGLSLSSSLFNGYAKSNELASLPMDSNSVKHGTAACGAVLYGELNEYEQDDTIKKPNVFVESFRVLPEEDLYLIIDNIEKVVKERKDIKIYNISFGPVGPIEDDEIDRFTYVLDKLAYENDVIFCVAAGNDGRLEYPFNRIQSPSDLVNGLGVGAFSHYNGHKYRANYSCIGLGREGAKVKPDLLAFGGDSKNLFHAIGINENERNYIAGTSFASPVVAGRLGELISSSSEISNLMARAMLIQTAQSNSLNLAEEGFGILNTSIDEILNCTDKKVSILYTGELSPKGYVKLPIPLPKNIKKMKGTVEFEWTIVSLTDVNVLDSDGYTLGCIEDTFYPHSNKYSFCKKGEKPVKINLYTDAKKVVYLEKNGYKKSAFPVTDSPRYRTEEERREDLKWDTVVRKRKNKKVSSLNNPFLIMHCMSREEKILQKVKFCVMVTITHKNYDGDLYEDLILDYPMLVPLETTIENEIDINI